MTMNTTTPAQTDQNKHSNITLILIIIALGAPLPTAWIAWYWEIALPKTNTAAGILLPDVANLNEWQLKEIKTSERPPIETSDTWRLVYTTTESPELADMLWRVHRALGRDADRLSRYELVSSPTSLKESELLPGSIRFVSGVYDQLNKHIYLVDPSGKIVLSYIKEIDPKKLLTDIRKVLKKNPKNTFK